VTPSAAILLTRPAPQSGEFAERLRDLPAEILISPILTIQPVTPTPHVPPGRALILTSRNAVTAAAGLVSGRAGYVVGAATARAAAAAGLTIRATAATAKALGDLMIAEGVGERLAHLRGEHTAGDLAGRLNSAGIETESIIFYRQPDAEPSARALAVLGSGVDVVMPLFSARSAALLGNRLNDADIAARLHLVSISAAVDCAWTGPAPSSRSTAASPDADAVADKIRALVAELS